MNYKIKPALSLAVIGLFIFFAAASFGPDGSTNTTVDIKDCEEMPAVSVQLSITVYVNWEGLGGGIGLPVNGAFGKLFITHQKVNSNDDCTYIVDFTQTIDFVCGHDGTFSYTGNTWLHDNAKDLIRVEYYLSGSVLDGFGPERCVDVRTYDQGQFHFSSRVFPIL